MIAPAIELPVRKAKETTLKTIPILVARVPRSVVGAANETANSDWIAEATSP
jgi:hypothetical protein